MSSLCNRKYYRDGILYLIRDNLNALKTNKSFAGKKLYKFSLPKVERRGGGLRSNTNGLLIAAN